MKKKFRLLPVLALLVIIHSCSKTGTVTDQTKTITLPSNAAPVLNAGNQFAFSFFRSTLQNDTSTGNKLISPLSIYLALSMAYNGSNNATQDSIANTLNLAGISIDQLNAVCQSMINQFPAEDNFVQLGIANSIWYRKSAGAPLPGFLNPMQNDYSAYIQPVEFGNQAAVTMINNWGSQKTNGKIPTIISMTSASDLMYLINAVYFNGKWENEFKTSATYNDFFYLPSGNTESVPFMQQELTTNFYINNAYSIAELPYGGGKSFSMYVIEPNSSIQSLAGFAASFNVDSFTQMINQTQKGRLSIIIPKWEYSYAINDMKPELSALGMGIAFTDAADFSKIYDPVNQPAKISQAIHKTYIKVNEEGTEAAALTAIGISPTAVPTFPIMKLDHPFLYAIVEKQTGTVFFLGVLNDPAQN